MSAEVPFFLVVCSAEGLREGMGYNLDNMAKDADAARGMALNCIDYALLEHFVCNYLKSTQIQEGSVKKIM